MIAPPLGTAPPAATAPPALLPSVPLCSPSSFHAGVADVCSPQPVEDRNIATPVTLPPLAAVVPNDADAAGLGGVDEDAKPGATKKSASPIPPPAACRRCGAVDVLAKLECRAVSRTPTASLPLEGLGGIGVRAKPDAPPIAATAIPSTLFFRRTMDVVAELVANQRSATPMAPPASSSITSTCWVMESSSANLLSSGLLLVPLLPPPPWDEAQAWAQRQ